MTTDREELDEMKKRKKAIASVGVILLVLGGAITIVAALPLMVYPSMLDEEHLTDDSLPMRDEANATYTYDYQWFQDQIDNAGWYVAAGFIPFVVGYALLIVSGAFTSETKLHRMHCDGKGETKYCSECGLKLSRLER